MFKTVNGFWSGGLNRTVLDRESDVARHGSLPGRWLQMILFQAALLDLTGSEEIGLLHDAEELLLIDLAIAIAISFVDHLLKLLISHSLSKLLRHTLQVLERDLACLIVIKQPEGLEDLVLGVAIQDLVGHHLQELFVLDGTTAIVVDVRDHLLNLFLLGLEAKSAHGNLELLRVDRAPC